MTARSTPYTMTQSPRRLIGAANSFSEFIAMNENKNTSAPEKARSSNRKWLYSLVFVVGIVLVVWLLFFAADHPRPVPALPQDDAHRQITDWKTCQDCHADGRSNPMPAPPHPYKKNECFRCHKISGNPSTPPGGGGK